MNRICMILGLASASLCGCTAPQPVASPGALESSPMLFGAGDDLGLATHLELSYLEGDMTALGVWCISSNANWMSQKPF